MHYIIPIEQIIHVTEPFDTSQPTNCLADYSDYPSYSQVTFKWDAVPDAVVYKGSIEEWRESPYEFISRDAVIDGSNTVYVADLPSSSTGMNYQFTLYAYDQNGTEIAQLMVQSAQCYGWDYRFRIR